MKDPDLRAAAAHLYELINRLDRLIEARVELLRHIRFEPARASLGVLDKVIEEVQLEVRKGRVCLGMSADRNPTALRR